MGVIAVSYDPFLGPILYRFSNHATALNSFKTSYAKIGAVMQKQNKHQVHLVRNEDAETICIGAIYPLEDVPVFENVIHF